MTLYEELKARGLVAQITDEEIIDLINNGKATFYIGFDCTADSLTAGHFLALTLMKRLQMAGGQTVGGAVKANVEGGLAVVDHFPNLFLVGHLSDQSAGNQFIIQFHIFHFSFLIALRRR